MIDMKRNTSKKHKKHFIDVVHVIDLEAVFMKTVMDISLHVLFYFPYPPTSSENKYYKFSGMTYV